MKLILPILFGAIAIVLAVALFKIKSDDDTQHLADIAAVDEYSNKLVSAQAQIKVREGTVLAYSNNLEQSMAVSIGFSNQWAAALAEVAQAAEQMTNLNRQLVAAKAGNQSLNSRILDLTNQMAGLNRQMEMVQSSLNQTNAELVQAWKEYLLLENRFRIDVAERTVVERKFNDSMELQNQIRKLKQSPAPQITAESIYAGLNVEVRSNGTFHVIAPE